MHRTGELAEARSEQCVLLSRMINGGDVLHELRHFIHERREPFGVEVLLPAEAVFAVFDGFAGAFIGLGAEELIVAGDGVTRRTQVGEELQQLVNEHACRAEDQTGEKGPDVAPRHC